MNKKILLYGLLFLFMISSAFAVFNPADFNETIAQELDDNVLFFYRMNSEHVTGSTLEDLYGVNDATLFNSPTVTSTYIEFDGSSQYATSTTTDAGYFTLISQFEADTTSPSNQGIISKKSSGTSGKHYGFQMRTADLSGQVSTGSTYAWFTEANAITAGVKATYSYQYDGSDEALYDSDSLLKTGGRSVGAQSNPTDAWTIARDGGYTNEFDGKMYYAAVFTIALDDNEREYVMYRIDNDILPPYMDEAPNSPPDTLTVVGRDAGNSSALASLNVTWNGTTYTNSTGNIVSINISAEGGNVNLTQNFTVVSENYFVTSVENWNLSTSYTANLTQYKRIKVVNKDNASTFYNFDLWINGTRLFSSYNDNLVDVVGYSVKKTSSDYVVYLPYNDTQTITVKPTWTKPLESAFYKYAVVDLSGVQEYVFNATRYPLITAKDLYDDSSINSFSMNLTVPSTNTYVTTNGEIYAPYNSTRTVYFGSNGYFPLTKTIDFTGPSDYQINLSQSENRFNVTEIITNNTATGTITIGATTKNSNETWYLPPGSYTALFEGTGYFDAELSFNVSALDNKTHNITVSGSIINVTATKAYTGDVISGFTVCWEGTNITYTGCATPLGSSYPIPALQGYGYNITVSKTGYITKSTVYTTPTNYTNAAFTLYATNHIVVNFFDEVTRDPVLDVNYTLTSSDFGFVGSTSNGTVSFVNLETDRFILAYEGINYTLRNHIFYIPSITDSQTNRSLYLLQNDVASDFVLTVTNKLGQTVEGLTASLLRQYVINNQTTYEVVEMMLPSVALGGATRFTAIPNYVPYLFRVQDENQNILFQGSGTTTNNQDWLYLIDTAISIKVDTGVSPFDLSQSINGFQYTLTNTSNAFWFSYDDTESALSSYTLIVYANGTEVVGSTTSTSSAASLSVAVAFDNSTTYRAVAYGTDGETDLRIAIDSYTVDSTAKQGYIVFGILSWFILFLSLIIFTIGLASNLSVAIILDILAIIAFSTQFIGIIEISTYVQSGLLIVGLFIVYLMRRDS